MNSLQALKQCTSEAYLAHRLNQPELLKVVSGLQAAENGEASLASVRHQIDSFSPPRADWRGQVEGSLDEAHQYLGLQQKFEGLRQDRVWSPFQRAVYRRLSAPANDPSLAPQDQPKSAFVATALSLFKELDSNGNGRLTPDELDTAMASGRYTGEQAAALVTLRASGPSLEKCVKERGHGVSRDDLKAFNKHGIPDHSEGASRIHRGFNRLVERSATLPPRLPLDQEDFRASEIYQAKPGSCVMLSTSAGNGLGDLREMFHDNHDGTVTVTFKDGAKETVRDLTEAERLYHSKAGRELGRWPGLLEMAMGQRVQKSGASEDGTARSGANYLPPRHILTAMSGYPGRLYSLDSRSPDASRDLLERLTQQDQPVICGSRDGWGEDDHNFTSESLHNGIVNNHAYTVLGYDRASDTVKLSNPWHEAEWTIKPDSADDGKFEMPLLDFYASYRWVASAVA